MENQSDIQWFEELDRQADSELGLISEMAQKTAQFYADVSLKGADPALRVAEIARNAEREYRSRGEAVPPHVLAAASLLKPELMDPPTNSGGTRSERSDEEMLPRVCSPLGESSQTVHNVIAFDRRRRDTVSPVNAQTSDMLCDGQLALKAQPEKFVEGVHTTKDIFRVIPFRWISGVKRSTSDAATQQLALDFIPAARQRRLKTDVEAQVFCDQPVATPTHRFVATAIDGTLIVFGFGLLVTLYEVLGGRFGAGKMFWAGLAAVFALVSLLYGLIWAIAGRETPGMRMTDLQLITFDGFEVDARTRVLRFASAWLSFCAGGLGVLWAVADEENLTWHDHISRTFPTIREVGAVVRRRKENAEDSGATV
jgi:uncharacterized RDD family membrane protein YckC